MLHALAAELEHAQPIATVWPHVSGIGGLDLLVRIDSCLELVTGGDDGALARSVVALDGTIQSESRLQAAHASSITGASLKARAADLQV